MQSVTRKLKRSLALKEVIKSRLAEAIQNKEALRSDTTELLVAPKSTWQIHLDDLVIE